MKDRPDSHDFDAWLAADLLYDLTPEERTAFELYLRENPDARSLHHQTAAMSHLLDATLAGARPGANFETRLLRAFREQRAQHPLSKLFGGFWEFLTRSIRLPAVYIPATAALLVGLVTLGSSLTRPMESDRSGNLALAVNSQLEASADGSLFQDESSAKFKRVRSLADSPLNNSAAPTSIAAPMIASGGTMNVSGLAVGTGGSRAVGSLRRTISESSETKNGLTASDKLTYTAGHGYADGSTVNSGTLLGFSSAPFAVAKITQPTASPLELQQQTDAVQAPSGQENQGIVDGRKLVRNASLDLEVKNYDTALDSITAIAAGNSGYVATKNSARLPNGKMSGTVVIKVLPGRLDDALLQIRSLGELKNQSLSTHDVTKEYFDTDARLRNARKMEERLLALLDTMKGKITELLAVEKELARVREQIEEMQGDLKVYDSLVQYATITISLREKDLNAAAAYLLKESVTLSLFSSDVEKSFESARRNAEAAKAQIVQSRLVRDDSGRVTGILTLLIAPDEADGLIASMKGLGRVQNFNKEDQRVAQDGSENSITAKTERDKVQLNLTILPDDESRKEVSLTVITKQVETLFESAKVAATAQGASILSSALQHPGGDGTSATLTVRVPAKNFPSLLETFKKSGIVSQFAIQRDDTSAGDAASAPVLIALTLTDADQPVQFTQAAILTPDVEAQAAKIKQTATTPDSQIEVKTSTFERTTDGRQNATLVLRLPLAKYQAFLWDLEKLGKVKDLSVRRADRTDAASTELATAQITLQLYSQGNVVTEDNGLFTTLRKTLGQAVASLMWSVRMIGVALAFIAPWGVVLALLIWIVRKISSRKSQRAQKNPLE